ncbi:M91 family zinc metallopeptidase [Bradyrhizobium sp. th.b2]|uniref:M91 family zinc metallopeptidase n=1 Tax=Bradyrhizobium sp. th-b2 TaxID=172088 RepID=UPI00048C7731|nr:M91 family zinc metallopeptidase [Bradyrhizobium sp. th.b2]
MVDGVDLTELDYDILGFTLQQNEQYKKFNKYIEKHASPLGASMLEWDLVDPVIDEGLPDGILIAFRSMGSWMVVNHESADNHPGKFDLLKQKYIADKSNYRRQIVCLLKQIQSYPTGRALLAEFGAGRPSFTRIRPYNMADANALTVADDIDQQQYIIARGTRLSFDKKSELFKVVGKGGGANCDVLFSPEKAELLRKKYRKAHHGHAPAMATDEVLYHELVHASRMIAGVMNFTPANHWYQDSEEYLAVILANIYVSDKGGPPLFRAFYGPAEGPYKGKDPAPDDALWDAAVFLDNPQNTSPSPVQIIEQFRLSQPDLYGRLVHLPPVGELIRKYNWIYWYDQIRVKGRTRARGPMVGRPAGSVWTRPHLRLQGFGM